MQVTVRDRDNGLKSVRRELFSGLNKIEVGVLGVKAAETYENGVKVWEAAMFAEFGTKNQPSRSWLRGWFDENEDRVTFWFRGEMELVVQGQQTREQALERVAQRCVHSIKQRILQGIPPPNAPATIKKKGFDFPLFHTGKLLEAIGFRKA